MTNLIKVIYHLCGFLSYLSLRNAYEPHNLTNSNSNRDQPSPQGSPPVPVGLGVGVASTIPEDTELIHATVVVTVVVTVEHRNVVLVPAVLITALDFFVPDYAAPGFVEVEFGVNTAFEPSN